MHKVRTVGMIVATLTLGGVVALWWRDADPPEVGVPISSDPEAVPAPAGPIPSASLQAPSVSPQQVAAQQDPVSSPETAVDPSPGGLADTPLAVVPRNASNLAALELPASAVDLPPDPQAVDSIDSPNGFRERPSMSAHLASQKSQYRVHFALDQYRLEPEAITTLEALFTELAAGDGVLKLVVDGHCDDSGTDQYNQALSEMRAEVVVDFLRQRGLEMREVVTRGFGERIPAVPGGDEESRAINRRAEIRVDWVRKIQVQEASAGPSSENGP